MGEEPPMGLLFLQAMVGLVFLAVVCGFVVLGGYLLFQFARCAADNQSIEIGSTLIAGCV